MVNAQNLAASSAFYGFKNYPATSATSTIPSQPIAAASYIKNTITISLNNKDAVSCIKIQYASIEPFWRQAQGFTYTGIVAGSYSLQSNAYYSGGNLVVDTYAVDQTGAGTVLPVQVINVQPRLYKSPFSTV